MSSPYPLRWVWFKSLLTSIKDRGRVESFTEPLALVNIKYDQIQGTSKRLDCSLIINNFTNDEALGYYTLYIQYP